MNDEQFSVLPHGEDTDAEVSVDTDDQPSAAIESPGSGTAALMPWSASDTESPVPEIAEEAVAEDAPAKPNSDSTDQSAPPAAGDPGDVSLGDAVLAWLDTSTTAGAEPVAQVASEAPPVRRRRAKRVAAAKLPTLDVDVVADQAPSLPTRRRAKRTEAAPVEAPGTDLAAEAATPTEAPAAGQAPTVGADAGPAEPAHPFAHDTPEVVAVQPNEEAEQSAERPTGMAVLFQPPTPPRRRRAASRPAGPPVASVFVAPTAEQPATTAASEESGPPATESEQRPETGTLDRQDLPTTDETVQPDDAQAEDLEAADSEAADSEGANGEGADADADAGVAEGEGAGVEPAETEQTEAADLAEQDESGDGEDQQQDGPRRRRRRGGRGRRRRSEETDKADAEASDSADPDSSAARPSDPDAGSDEPGEAKDTDAAQDAEAEETEAGESGSRRRRRRRRSGSEDSGSEEQSGGSGGKSRNRRTDEVTGVQGSTRLEAKRQRRREGRESGRRRQIITEAEFLARRESVERTMLVREKDGRTQLVVLEDNVLVEHYVARKAATSMIGNIYLGRVQNVLPSMEAAFVDIGRGRNAVLYAGEVNWDAAGLQGGSARRIELALKAGDSVLVQVSKDPIGHKGARLTSQISLPGRYLVYVPGASLTGISRKLPFNERNRLKKVLRSVVPEDAGVIVRTAAEGASEEELKLDVERLQRLWSEVEKKAKTANAATMLHGEPELIVKVVRDIFNEDFKRLIIDGEQAWSTIKGYLDSVAPDLGERVSQWDNESDLFESHRVDEQIAKGLERKVWLPSGGSLVIDRTEAMTVIDVNTGKFVGSGGNLEETVTRNNLEAAEEIVRQLRLRDIGGIVVIDFIDMVLEANRDLVLRRLVECLGRDRTKHQVAEVTSLGLVQMTRKRMGQGLLESFSEPCEHCAGRGVVVQTLAVDQKPAAAARQEPRRHNEAQRVAEAARKAKERQASREAAEASEASEIEAPPGETPVAEAAVEAAASEARVAEAEAGQGPVAEAEAGQGPVAEAAAGQAPVAELVSPAPDGPVDSAEPADPAEPGEAAADSSSDEG